jgi:ribokinase
MQLGTAINVTAANAGHRRASLYFGGADPALPRFARGNAPRQLLVCGWPHPPLDVLAASFHQLRSFGTFTALDAGPILGPPWSLEALRPVLATLDLFLANEHELRTITQARATRAAKARLRRLFPGHLVIKRGREGALWVPAGGNEAHAIRAPRVRAVNTVGAGDTFNGALLAALGRHATFPLALRYACETAASVVSSGAGVLGVRPPRLPR